MKRWLLWSTAAIFWFVVPNTVFSLPPDVEEEDEEEVDEDEELEFEEFTEWGDDLEETYTPLGADGPIALDEIPSIIEPGTFWSTEVDLPVEHLEEHTVDLVEIK